MLKKDKQFKNNEHLFNLNSNSVNEAIGWNLDANKKG